MIRLKIQASRTGWPSGPRTWPVTVCAAAEHQVHFLAVDARFQVECDDGVRVDPPAARLAFAESSR